MTDKLYEFCLGKAREIFDAFIAGKDVEQEICYPDSCRIYRHYGAKKYNPDEFRPVENRELWNKPGGGLWASDIKSEIPWEVWCRRELFNIETLDVYFEFQLKPNTRVLRFENREQVKEFLQDPQYGYYVTMMDMGKYMGRDHMMWPKIDFENLSEIFDAVEIMAGSDEYLYDAFYGWDCDSIVILNKEVIEPIEK